MLITVVVLHPAATVMDALAEQTCALAAELPSVAEARLVSRRITADGRVLSVQRWRARADLPDLLRPHIEESLLDWKLHLERRIGALDCRWSLRALAATWPLRCRGTLACTPAVGGRGTRIEMQCTFAAANPGVQTILRRLLDQHLRSLATAAARRISAGSPAA